MPENSVYLRILNTVNSVNISTFAANMATEIQYSHVALYGRLCRSMEVIPVPNKNVRAGNDMKY
jgi:hypothetical protein